MPRIRHAALTGFAIATLALSLTACSGGDSVVGVWIAPDGSSAFINEDGSCRGMYYNQGQPLDIGGPMTCAYSGSTLVVSQPPNQTSFDVSFSGDTMTISNSANEITFTKG